MRARARACGGRYVDLFQKNGGSMITLAKGNRSKQVLQCLYMCMHIIVHTITRRSDDGGDVEYFSSTITLAGGKSESDIADPSQSESVCVCVPGR